MTEQSHSTLPAAVAFGDQSLTIIDHDGTPWLSAADLARALGYKRADFVAQLYRKHADEFTAGMSENVESTFPGNLRTQQRIFSPRGCHLIAMFARTERAAAFRRWVLDVLEGLAAPHRQSTEQLVLRSVVGQRWLVYFDTNGAPHLTPVPAGAVMVEPDKLPELLADPGSNFRRTLMPAIIDAAVKRLAGPGLRR